MPTKGAYKLTLQLSDQSLVPILQDIARRFGYIQSRGGAVGKGSISQLIEAIAKDKIKLYLPLDKG